MKEGIHPEYVEATVICGCGETWKTRSTKKLIKVEICSKCHPFYTGTQKLVDSAGRVEKFIKRYGWTGQQAQAAVSSRKQDKPEAPAQQETAEEP